MNYEMSGGYMNMKWINNNHRYNVSFFVLYNYNCCCIYIYIVCYTLLLLFHVVHMYFDFPCYCYITFDMINIY